MVCLPSGCPLSFVTYPRWSVKKNDNTSDLLVGDLFVLGLGSRGPQHSDLECLGHTVPPTGELLSLSLEVLANP